MSFKLHLIIVSVIIVVVLAAWSLTKEPPPAPAVVENVKAESEKMIEIIHAHWGRNCRNMRSEDSVFVNQNSDNTLKDDNVLQAVSKICNSRSKCEIEITPEVLGADPAPQCHDKVLEVEYRCFSFDRPWNVNGSRKSLKIDCTK